MAATLRILVSGQERGALWACIAHERRATPPETKRLASRRAAGKMADWFVEKLGRIADAAIAFLLPFGHFF
ncbi:MAG TPA: hypothetical protein VFA87_07955 [Rhizomicrobium sp.]|nr:hypothetical protein [Rhizomicrobium sp.]